MLGKHALIAVVPLALAVGACNLLNGSSDLLTSDGLRDGLSPDGGRAGDGAGGGTDGGGTTGGDGGGATDDGGGGFIADAGINPKVNACGQNLVCLPNASGWSPAALLVSFGGGPGSACPAEFPQATDLMTSGGGSCGCTCTPSGGSCAGGVASKSGAACAGASTALAAVASSCSTIAATLPLPVAFVPTSNGLPPSNCGGTVSPGLGDPKPARVCTGAVPVSGTNCATGEVCVKQTNFPFGGLTCIIHDGDIACPRHLDYRVPVGAAVADGRSCNNTCSCQPEPCGGTLEAFSDTACATSVNKVNVDGTCTMAGTDMTGMSYRFTPSLGCGVSVPAKVLGTETYTAQRTLCCSFGF
ncbi:MAG: hypothetical protein QOI41_4445 [Myxococcales bacterium]|jgi:hypothetical protein|nr:hypothetical protein [Myxococcales bacterium]